MTIDNISCNLCPISQPLDIIHNLINESEIIGPETVQKYFETEILSLNTLKSSNLDLIDNDSGSSSLIKLDEILIIQDCLEDEYYQPIIKRSDGIKLNSGLWTRTIYEPKGIESCPLEFNENLQVRKRLLAVCKASNKPFILAMYRNGADEEAWESWREETFKMNSLHSIIGIYEACDSELERDEDYNGLSASLPTIHLMKRSDFVIPKLVPIETDSMKQIKSKLIDYLMECFGGACERNAIESLILLLVSKPSMRVDGLIDSLFIGKLSLNLCFDENNCNHTESIANFFKIMKELKHFTASVKVDEESFSEEGVVYPRIEVKSGEIVPGAVLQQPDGCLLVVDETGIVEGQVFKDQGVKNLQALIDLIRQQHVNYDFGIQQVTLKTDIPVITISKGKKSVLPFDLSVCGGNTCNFVESGEFGLFKSYLEGARSLNFSVTEEMATFLEQDYLTLRKTSPLLPNGNPKMNEQEFHRLMNLARLKSVSVGEVNLSVETWTETKSMFLI